jgi:uncharacterized membrane protein HdeD (DUF308 family)
MFIYQIRCFDAVMATTTSGIGIGGFGTPVPLPRWLVLIQGIVALALGILLLAYPVGILLVLTVLLGIYWMINGIFVLASLYSDRSDRGWKTVVGVLGIIAGILVLAYPLYSTYLLPTFLAIIIGVEGLIIGAVHLVRGFSGAGTGAGVLGIVSIIFGIILIANPFIAALALVTVLAVLAIIGGALTIIIALRRPA